jgi:hypothetical protein
MKCEHVSCSLVFVWTVFQSFSWASSQPLKQMQPCILPQSTVGRSRVRIPNGNVLMNTECFVVLVRTEKGLRQNEFPDLILHSNVVSR